MPPPRRDYAATEAAVTFRILTSGTFDMLVILTLSHLTAELFLCSYA